MMTSGAKKEFKRFQSFYKLGQLQKPYIDRLKKTYEREETGVVDSWFQSCKDQYGNIDQPQVGGYEVLEQSLETSNG